jgi:ABC-type Fe3+ transport system permease subunit
LTLVLTLLVIAMLVLPKWLARQGRNRKTQTRNTGEKRTLRSVR